MPWRWSSVSAGAGASSMSFWKRRWVEQSRVPRTATLPCVRIGQDLRLDVARVGEELLHVALRAAEGLLGLAASGVEGGLDVLEVFDHLEAASAATISSLDGDGQAVLFGEGAGFLPVIDGIGGARGQGRADLFGYAARGNLVTEQLDGLRRRANTRQAGLGHGAGKVGVFGEEAVARVDGVGTGAHCDIEQRGNVHVGIRRGVAGQRVGLVGHLGVQGAGIGLRVNSDGANTQVAGGAGDTDGDLAAVSNKDCRNHDYPSVCLSEFKADRGSRGELRGDVDVFFQYGGDDRIAAGHGVVPEENHGLAAGRYLD